MFVYFFNGYTHGCLKHFHWVLLTLKEDTFLHCNTNYFQHSHAPPSQYLPLRGNQMSGFNHNTLVLPVHELCMNETIQYIVCVPLLLSCIIVIIQFICVVAHSSISFFLVFHCMNIQQFNWRYSTATDPFYHWWFPQCFSSICYLSRCRFCRQIRESYPSRSYEPFQTPQDE